MKMYWVLIVGSSNFLHLPSWRKVSKDNPLDQPVVIDDIYDVIDACCYLYDEDEGIEYHRSLDEDTVRLILSMAQFEDGEESKSNLKALQDLMEIFPGLIQEFGVDYRPTEVIPEDYYAY